jgi:FkbM family methyltransferase
VNGVYEPEVLKLHKRELKEGDVYIDVGANIGDTGLFAASLVGKSGQVICFEPIKDLASQIEKSKNENDFTQLIVVNKGLSNENKKAFIYKNDKNIGASSLIDLGTSVDKEEIVLTCGEEELGRLKRIDFIKVDVEGHEVSVFDVLRERISTFKPKIIFEFTPKMYGENKLSILYMLQGFGYKIFDLEENELEIKDIGYWYKCFESKGRLQTNLFCVFKNIS